MMNYVFKALLFAGGAVATYLMTNQVVLHTTGRSIPQHVMGLWEDIRTKILQWSAANRSRLIGKITLRLAYVLDSAYIKSKKLLPMSITAETNTAPQELIMEREVSAADLADLMPELVGKQTIVLEA